MTVPGQARKRDEVQFDRVAVHGSYLPEGSYWTAAIMSAYRVYVLTVGTDGRLSVVDANYSSTTYSSLGVTLLDPSSVEFGSAACYDKDKSGQLVALDKDASENADDGLYLRLNGADLGSLSPLGGSAAAFVVAAPASPKADLRVMGVLEINGVYYQFGKSVGSGSDTISLLDLTIDDKKLGENADFQGEQVSGKIWLETSEGAEGTTTFATSPLDVSFTVPVPSFNSSNYDAVTVPTLSFNSSNEDAVKVDDDGVIHILQESNGPVTITDSDNNLVCTLRVTKNNDSTTCVLTFDSWSD